MMLDMDEWYLLFQPLFENYFEPISSDQCFDSVPFVRAATDLLFFQGITFFFNLLIYPVRPETHRRMKKTTDAALRKLRLFNYKKNRDWAENLTIVMQLGLTMAGCIVFCFFVGHYLDKWLGLKGVFTTVFILLGIAGGANVCYRQILEIIEPKDKADPDGDGYNGS